MKLPPGHQTVMPYLIVKGAARFIDFAKNVFQAKEISRHLSDEGTVVHAEIMMGNATVMIGDSNEKWTPRPASLYIYSDDVDRDYKKAINAGATSLIEPVDQPYGRTCGVEDVFGNVWWITAPPKE